MLPSPAKKHYSFIFIMYLSAATIFVVFFIFLHDFSAAQNYNCSIDFCSRSFIPVRFPFYLQGDGQPPSCGFPGFELSCSGLGISTVLRLPNSGEDFFVRNIDYLNQIIVLYDPRNCLAGRLLELNLTGSPFSGSNYDRYTLFDCPTNITFAVSSFNIVRCLSNATNTVVATTNHTYANALSNSSCVWKGTYRVPISRLSYYRQATASDLSRDLELSWNAPNCRDCELKGGVCSFRNYTAQEIGCFNGLRPRRRDLNTFRLVSFTIAVPAALCAVAVGCFIGCANRGYVGAQSSNTQTTQHNNLAIVPQPPVLPIGLDDSTIQSFEKVVLGESRRVAGPNHSVCSICLSEYLPKDILRCIPECAHCFHADCVDEWLRMNSSCPICRNSPTPSPAHVNSPQTVNEDIVV